MKTVVPSFAVVGHPNEGKSSVLSTLAEDDSVRISPVPGETSECRAFPVIIDGREILCFTDTPGFQNPRNTLRWMQNYEGPETDMVKEFVRVHKNDPAYRDDCELLTPLLGEAGIIFVVDGSRPVRNVDRAEMEILRMIGRPRMAIINNKEDDTAYLAQWKSEFRKHFNSIRIFNSNRATYAERIALLENLKSIDQDLQGVLEIVISAFQQDWAARNQRTAEALVTMLAGILTYQRTVPCPEGTNEVVLREKLRGRYERFVAREEQKMYQQIRSFYKHNIFNYDLPEHSILQEDLFSERTWQFLGLSTIQLILAGALSGAAIGAGFDVAHAGLTFGVYSALGCVIGAAGTALKGQDLFSGARLLGMKLDHHELQVGPVKNIQLLYILLDRSLIFYSHIINWAHGRRDYAQSTSTPEKPGMKQGYTTDWDRTARQTCEAFFKGIQEDDAVQREETGNALKNQLTDCLASISRDRV
jgi:GTP-binding protein EngB required for normal cell division